MEKRSAVLFFSLILAAVQICASAGQVSHCVYGVTVKDLLKLARINGSAVQSYVVKLKQHKVDETVLGSLTLQQLQDIGITALGDRLKIFNFFSKDPDDCGSSLSTRCQNKGICRDGYRCFTCVCDPKSGYYGPSCEFKCPCLNRGVCKTTRTGFECVCPPGYSGDLCNTKYLNEERFLKLEETLKQLTMKLEQSEVQMKNQDAQIKSQGALIKNQDAEIKNQDAQIKNHDAQIKNQDAQMKNQDAQIKNQDAQIKNQDTQIKNQYAQIKKLQCRPTGSWQLYRANEIIDQLEKMQLSGQTPTYTQRLPIVLPMNTRAILISIYCNFWNHKGHAYLNYVTHQKDNDDAAAKAEGYNTHFNVYANTFLYEQMIPWNTTLPNELIFRVTNSRLSGGNRNWYRVRLVGYVTSS